MFNTPFNCIKMNDKKKFSYKRELIRSCIYALIAIIFANLAFFSIPKDITLNNLILTILLFVLEILTLIFMAFDIIKIDKRKIDFIKSESIFVHNPKTPVRKEDIIEELKRYGYSIYSVEASSVAIKAEVKKKKKATIIYAYYFILIDLDKDGESVIKKISEEMDDIFSLYLDDNDKIFDKEKEKDSKVKTCNQTVFIMYGDTVTDKIIENCKIGYPKEKILANCSEIFLTAYIPKKNALYYAEAIERVITIKKLPKRDFTYIIKDIFDI